ncbi:MAG TPA: hypothetical protein VIC62_02665 [Nakamurella sp.]|jgi:hypothetical protein
MTRVRVEVVLAAVFAVLAVLTAIWPTWIEALFEASPDSGSGAFEWAIVGACGLLAVACAVLAGRDYRQLRRA